jgi:hypothetical protein
VALNTIKKIIKNIHLLVMDGSGYEDYIVHESNYHTITATTAPPKDVRHPLKKCYKITYQFNNWLEETKP